MLRAAVSAREPPPSRRGGLARSLPLAAALLVALTVAAYLPSLRAGFIWDDDAYVTANRQLDSAAGLARIWTDRRSTPQYYPLVFTSFWLQKRVHGLEPFGYHLANVLLHAANAVLVWLILRRLSLPAAWLAAAVFALHPVHVESVAWVTERKNVLSGLGYLASFLVLLRLFPPDPGEAPPRRPRLLYALALGLFACALLAKSVTSSLPAAFLLVLWWKRGRVGWRDALPLLPFFLLGAVAGANTALLEKYKVGTHGPEFALSALQRTLVAGRDLWFYLGKLLWPHPLIFIYPRWPVASPAWWWYLLPAGFLALAAALWAGRGRAGRGPLTALLFFAGSLFPALGFVNFYPMRYSFVADHFQYLAALGALAFRQCRAYRDGETLWRDTIAKDPGSPLANLNLGAMRFEQGRVDEAKRLFERALVDKPDFAQAWYNLGLIRGRQGDLAGAIRDLGLALRYNPYLAEAYENLGVAYGVQGDPQRAAQALERAVSLKPENLSAWLNLATARGQAGDLGGAVEAYRAALTRHPGDATLRQRLATAEAALARRRPGAD